MCAPNERLCVDKSRWEVLAMFVILGLFAVTVYLAYAVIWHGVHLAVRVTSTLVARRA